MSSQQQSGSGSRELVVGAGETLIREGEPGDTAFCILEGEVKVWKRSKAGEIELARLGPGAIFGEMSIVDEKPRSASITTLTNAKLKELRRDQFFDSFQHDPDFAASLLRVLLERLRETGAKLTQLQEVPTDSAPSVHLQATAVAPRGASIQGPAKTQIITLEGLTQPAREALPTNPYVIEKLPCRIGRSTDDKLAYNDLSLRDFEPYQISVNHLLIFQELGSQPDCYRIGIFDRGSSRGSWLNDQPLGWLMSEDTASFIEEDTAELVLGDADSLFRYRITVKKS